MSNQPDWANKPDWADVWIDDFRNVIPKSTGWYKRFGDEFISGDGEDIYSTRIHSKGLMEVHYPEDVK